MSKLAKKLSAIALCSVFASMQMSAFAFSNVDTGLGKVDPNGNAMSGAIINSATEGLVGVDTSKSGTATLDFNNNTHVKWDSLNVGEGETLNFNAVDGKSGLTVINTVVGSDMTQVYGTINSNEGISKLIISNPNGMLFDGASFTAAGDLQLTTQALAVNYMNGNLDIKGLNQEAINGITISNSTFDINGGTFNVTAPTVKILGGYIGADKGLKLVTANGQDFLLCPTTSADEYHEAVVMKAIKIDGDVHIVSASDLINLNNGGTINGNLTIDSDGNVALNAGLEIDSANRSEKFNYNKNTDPKLTVNGDVKVINDGRISYLRNAKVTGNVDMSNSGGFLEISDVNVDKDVNLTTTVKSNEEVKHFVHVVGDNDIKGNLNVDSIHNVHIGGYDSKLENLANGSLKVGKDLKVFAREGSVKVTVDTEADKVDLKSGTLNIITDGVATIKANDYKFEAKHYIGGVDKKENIIDAMENYKPIPVVNKYTYLNIEDGNISKVVTTDSNGIVMLRSNNNMNLDGMSGVKTAILSAGKDIVIGDDVHAGKISVQGETDRLTVNNNANARDYILDYINIKDTALITINPETEITYEMANGDNGWNKGVQTKDNTYLVVPGMPEEPPVDPEPVIDDNNENVKVLRNLEKNPVASAIDANQVYTPVAFAADLDEEIDTGVRKNVDGSVTVVRPFTPNN
ncbi:MAG: filamentous hemagglutinin N-terminal domain-containing protein [Cyanobacteria bacterium SIG31]|nr:filamentous hemagglutinin N-terminal domain-containing protein [Cyanobacteria bacterium SIG31]